MLRYSGEPDVTVICVRINFVRITKKNFEPLKINVVVTKQMPHETHIHCKLYNCTAIIRCSNTCYAIKAFVVHVLATIKQFGHVAAETDDVEIAVRR